VSLNISPDITGVGGWDDETFIRIMRTGNYTNRYKDTITVFLKDKKLWINEGFEASKDIELIPIAENQFHGSGLASPIMFEKDASGRVLGYVDQDMVPLTYAKIDTN
jgi:hypothetical protein